MAIRVRCPRCWQTAEVPEEARGKQGRCNACGSTVSIPARASESCFVCGADVAGKRHAKDAENNLLCQTCWEGRNPAQRAIFSKPELDAPPPPAPEAKPVVVPPKEIKEVKEPAKAETQVNDHPVFSHDELPEHSGHSHAASVAIVLAVLALVASAVGLWVNRGIKEGWERDNKGRVWALKAQAETLVALGKVKEGVDKYNELFGLVNGKVITDKALLKDIEDAKAAGQVAAGMRVDNWEDQLGTRLMVLKGQGDVLAAVGKYRLALEKYAEVQRLAAGRQPASAVLAEELRRAGMAQVELTKAIEAEKATGVARVEPPVPTPAPEAAPIPGTTQVPTDSKVVIAPEQATKVQPNIFDSAKQVIQPLPPVQAPVPPAPQTQPSATPPAPPLTPQTLPTTQPGAPVKSIFDN